MTVRPWMLLAGGLCCLFVVSGIALGVLLMRRSGSLGWRAEADQPPPEDPPAGIE